MKKKPGEVLVTGFGPFGGQAVNPSGLLAERMAQIPGVVSAVLPVSYAGATAAFIDLVKTRKPIAALCFGLSMRTDSVLIERLAWNRDESDAPDDDGAVREDVEIVAGGRTAYGATVPLPELMRVLAFAGLPTAVSDHAGGYVCNHFYYQAQHHLLTEGVYLPLAFIHVPPLPEQVADQPGRCGLSLDRLYAGAAAAADWLRRGVAATAPPEEPGAAV